MTQFTYGCTFVHLMGHKQQVSCIRLFRPLYIYIYIYPMLYTYTQSVTSAHISATAWHTIAAWFQLPLYSKPFHKGFPLCFAHAVAKLALKIWHRHAAVVLKWPFGFWLLPFLPPFQQAHLTCALFFLALLLLLLRSQHFCAEAHCLHPLHGVSMGHHPRNGNFFLNIGGLWRWYWEDLCFWGPLESPWLHWHEGISQNHLKRL